MSPLTTTVARRALRRGIQEGSRPWLAVGVVAASMAVIKRLSGTKPKVVYREVLQPGTRLEIRAVTGEGADGEPVGGGPVAGAGEG